jgi:23S rRNA (adenine2503-C2)-methyltransferase
MPQNPSIYNLSLNALTEQILTWGEPRYRAKQIWEGLYQHLYEVPDQFTALPRSLKQRLQDAFTLPFEINGADSQLSPVLHGEPRMAFPTTSGVPQPGQPGFAHLRPVMLLDSADGQTRKTLYYLPDGRPIEAVLMRYNQRNTLCISSQSGCAMGCVFCATGQMGFGRHLEPGEIIEQVLYYARLLATQKQAVTNIVIMGMGEPFHNYEATLEAISRLNDPLGLGLGERRFTISTVGLVPMIQRFTSERRQINLAVSLHAAEDDLRSSMLPINKKYPLAVLMDACRDYVEKTHRRISFEWALIHEVNDTPEQARKLAQLLHPLKMDGSSLCHVNAIPLNPTTQYSGKPTDRKRAEAFKSELESKGIPCTIRLRRGIDIQAGCGMLAGESTTKERNNT